jgi:hypothetical protein
MRECDPVPGLGELTPAASAPEIGGVVSETVEQVQLRVFGIAAQGLVEQLGGAGVIAVGQSSDAALGGPAGRRAESGDLIIADAGWGDRTDGTTG